MTPPNDPSTARTPTRVRRLDLTQHWLPDRPVRPLLCFEDADGHADGAFALCSAHGASEALARRIEGGAAIPLHEAARTLALPVLDAAVPLPLQPVRVRKAWGEEIWFTGIESRGVVEVGAGGVPLPWLLAARPDAFAGVAAPILVKVLAPSTSPDTGDLYFEVHREKEEVYVVTGVDAGAWPDGWGRVRYGFDPKTRKTLGDEGFRMAFATAASAHGRAQQALGPATAAGPAEGPALANVRRTRARLERFANIRGLEPGEVVRVPPGLPHGLMHGVRVIEFQTPAYERRVLYANQPLAPADARSLIDVLPELRMDVPADPRPVETEPAPGVRSACIARMRDFDVHRFELAPGAAASLPRAAYGVLVGVSGSVSCGGAVLTAEQAALLSGPALLRRLEAGDAGGTGLLAVPKAA